MKTAHHLLLLASFTTAFSVAVAAGDTQATGDAAALGDISRRLQAGDRTAIDELLARTKPATSDLAEANARAESLRAEVERLRGVRVPRLVPSRSSAPTAEPEPPSPSLEPVREARAWLYAGEPERSLKVLPNTDGEPAYWRGRALEKLGRFTEALESYRRAAAAPASEPSATSASTPASPAPWRAWAAADVAHLEWRARVAPWEAKP